jgi:hypothetical protein
MGAAYMAGIRTIQFASRDFWAGSANMLGTTPYLSMKPVTCTLQDDPDLEDAMITLNVEVFCHGTMRRNQELIERYAARAPRATAHGQRLHVSGALREAAVAGASAESALGLLRVPR